MKMNFTLNWRNKTDYQLITDAELLQRIADSSEQALTTLMQRYKNRVFSFIRLRIHQQQDAEEICQDVFVEISQILTINVGTVRSRISNARKKIVTILKKKEVSNERLQNY